jgi:hypothetical protein
MLNLEKDCVVIRKAPDEDENWPDHLARAQAAGPQARARNQ